MFRLEDEVLADLRERYPEGTVVVLVRMDDPYAKIPAGTKGIVSSVDDIGTVHVVWETGTRLGLVYGEDEYYALSEGE